MLTTFPSAWLALLLPFLSAGVIAQAGPLRRLSAAHHRITWSVGVVGPGGFPAGLAGLLPESCMLPAIILGGPVAGFSCFRTTSTDDGDDWRDSGPGPDDDGPPRLPDIPIDWQRFDRLHAQWGRRPAGRSLTRSTEGVGRG
jgi:hypothetical protein